MLSKLENPFMSLQPAFCETTRSIHAPLIQANRMETVPEISAAATRSHPGQLPTNQVQAIWLGPVPLGLILPLLEEAGLGVETRGPANRRLP